MWHRNDDEKYILKNRWLVAQYNNAHYNNIHAYLNNNFMEEQ